MDEETQKQLLASVEKIYNKGVKDGKGEHKAESKSQIFKDAIRLATSAAKKVEDGKSSANVEKLGKFVQGKFQFGKVPSRADIESVGKMCIEVALGMPLPEKKAKPKEKVTA